MRKKPGDQPGFSQRNYLQSLEPYANPNYSHTPPINTYAPIPYRGYPHGTGAQASQIEKLFCLKNRSTLAAKSAGGMLRASLKISIFAFAL